MNEQELRKLHSKLAGMPTSYLTEKEIRELMFALSTLMAENRRFEAFRGKDEPTRRYGLDVL